MKIILGSLLMAAVFISTGIGLITKTIPQYQKPTRGECVLGVGVLFLLVAIGAFVSWLKGEKVD